MPDNKKQQLLDALKFELRFLESGGYDPSVRDPRRESTIFRDSPSCLNYATAVREHPCSECWLIDFVTADKREESLPCHHIPLNERGDTIANIPSAANSPQVQEAMKDWLRKTIQRLEIAAVANG